MQRAIAMILEPIYEQDFLDYSYGYRPGRSAYDALAAIWRQCNDLNIRWILDIDIRKFFDTLKHDHLREFLQHRVRDGVITRLVGKWLKAGVWEQGMTHYPEDGISQGGCISPLLSNIYLHYVLDLWFAHTVKPEVKGRAFMIRYADDAVMGFECREGAERVLGLLSERLEQYGLVLHPEKTRLISFARPKGMQGDNRETFNFLGFTHYWGKSRRGKWIIKRKTSRSRFNRSLKRIAEWCRLNRHEPIAEQHKALCRKLQGHFAYYGITGNGPWLEKYKEGVKKLWCKWLNRRSHVASMPWGRFNCLLKHYRLPPAKVVHSIYVAKP